MNNPKHLMRHLQPLRDLGVCFYADLEEEIMESSLPKADRIPGIMVNNGRTNFGK